MNLVSEIFIEKNADIKNKSNSHNNQLTPAIFFDVFAFPTVSGGCRRAGAERGSLEIGASWMNLVSEIFTKKCGCLRRAISTVNLRALQPSDQTDGDGRVCW